MSVSVVDVDVDITGPPSARSAGSPRGRSEVAASSGAGVGGEPSLPRSDSQRRVKIGGAIPDPAEERDGRSARKAVLPDGDSAAAAAAAAASAARAKETEMDNMREKRLMRKFSSRAGGLDSSSAPRRKYPATTLVTDNLVQWQDEPQEHTCQFCGDVMTTHVVYRRGVLTYLSMGGICLLGGFLGCCFIPFCIDRCNDVHHVCSTCRRTVGIMPRV